MAGDDGHFEVVRHPVFSFDDLVEEPREVPSALRDV
jgi:hypothetical protein